MSHGSAENEAMTNAAQVDATPSAQVEQRLLRLSEQVSGLERTADALTAMLGASQDQLAVLLEQAVDPAREQGLNDRLAELAATLQAQHEATAQLSARTGDLAGGADFQTLLDTVARQEQLTALEDRLAKLVRTQFKSNTLSEAQSQQLARALDAMRGLAERRETREAESRVQAQERLHAAHAQGRRELAADLLPAIDGMELALENGHALLCRQAARVEEIRAAASQPISALTELQAEETVTPGDKAAPSRWQRLRQAWQEPIDARSAGQADAEQRTVAQAAGLAAMEAASEQQFALLERLHADTRAWLEGLALVQDRFARLLASDGIQPIEALGAPFNPRLHVAVDAVEVDAADSASQPERVVKVVRKGYLQDEIVLRYAEVVVARAVRASPVQVASEQALAATDADVPAWRAPEPTEAFAANRSRQSHRQETTESPPISSRQSPTEFLPDSAAADPSSPEPSKESDDTP